jgi:hypothetical protein
MAPRHSALATRDSVGITPMAFLFCRASTWTRVARASLVIAPLLGTMACSFRDYDYGVSSTATGGTSSQPTATGGKSTQLTTESGGTTSPSSTGTGGTGGASAGSGGTTDTSSVGSGGTTSPSSPGIGGVSSPSTMTGGAPSVVCPDGSGSCEPACVEVAWKDTGTHSALVTHWTFDSTNADASVPERVYDENNQYALTSHSDRPENSEAIALDDQVRINGHGASVRLDGHHYYATDTEVPSIQSGGTIAALISISHDTLPIQDSGAATVWPIISTIDKEHCSGYQLDMRLDAERRPEVAFTFAYSPLDASDDCETASTELPLKRPSWAWNTGHWHHVAATYMPQGANQARIALYWDSDSPNARLSVHTWVEGQMIGSTSGLFVGTNANDANNASSQKFKGNIDEIAVFDRPLTQMELTQFSLAATTYPGPSGCHWQATESHQDGVDAGISRTQWSPPDARQLQVQIHDEDWGAGAVAARLAAPGGARDLTPYSQAVLTADGLDAADTRNGSFEFALSAGDNSCTWYVAANGTNTYKIDLAYPDYCQTDPSSLCQFPIEQVEWAAIRSSWAYPTYFDRDPLAYTVHRLDFVKGNNLLDPTRHGGAIGPNNWCWRTQAFQAASSAEARLDTDAGSDSDELVAVLSGHKYSSSALAADFGDDTLDLSNCVGVRLKADIRPTEIIGAPNYSSPVLGLQDRSGSWTQWNWDETSKTISITVNGVSSDDPYPDPYGEYEFWLPYQHKFPHFNITDITLLAIQKNWMWPDPSSATDEGASLAVTGVEFVDKYNNPHCEIVNHH